MVEGKQRWPKRVVSGSVHLMHEVRERSAMAVLGFLDSRWRLGFLGIFNLEF